MLLYGEVGRGKSMLIDLLFSSLPSRKKRRWHFNTFMLDVIRRLELSRIQRAHIRGVSVEHEHSVLSLAKDTIATSPILFLDEFQLPDRASSKLMSGFMTAFFHLGGVLVASSNRMPEELSKASGVEFTPNRMSKDGMFRWARRRSDGDVSAHSDFGAFLDVLKARCETWQMEGTRDFRRDDDADIVQLSAEEVDAILEGTATNKLSVTSSQSGIEALDGKSTSQDIPVYYHIRFEDSSPSFVSSQADWNEEVAKLNPSREWTPAILHVYGRRLPISATSNGVALFSFNQLCATSLGPADYVSLASSFHTVILTDVPVLTTLLKNEARRFITLLDALYESRCRLLLQAAAPPDGLFFPELKKRAGQVDDGSIATIDESGESVYQETLSEIYYQDTMRPNISAYVEGDNSATPTQSQIHPSLRSVLADEDADFGPTYGNGRGHGPSSSESVMNFDHGPPGMAELEKRQGPDFTQTSALTGEDERFAYKRARSRLWEMCGKRWWREREGRSPEEWWMPVQREGRHWERVPEMVKEAMKAGVVAVGGSHDGSGRNFRGGSNAKDEGLFRHGASPFRTTVEPPPKFGWQHAWGMMTWGKKAGEWGKGVKGERPGSKQGGDGSDQQQR